MSKRQSGLHLAAGLFSVVPVPTVDQIDQDAARRAMAAFPWLGALLGLVAGLVAAGLSWLGLSALGAVAAVGTLLALTGGLHLDGVADTADALGSRRSVEQMLEIMKRSDIGPMGVAAVVFVLLADVAALVGLARQSPWWVLAGLVVAVMVSRLVVVLATLPGSAKARPGGFGALFVGVTRRRTGVAEVVAVTLVAGGVGLAVARWIGLVAFVAAAAVAVLFGVCWTRRLRHRLGGLTGDMFGSIIETTQTVALAGLAVAAALLMR